MTLGITGAVIGAVGAIGGSLIAGDSARSASNKQIDAAKAADAQHRADMAPWTKAGGDTVTRLASEIAPGGKYDSTFTMADAANSEAEKYTQQRAMEASQNSAAARGGLIGTNEQRDLQTNAAGIAGTFENQAFNQWLQTRQQGLNAEESVAGLGMQSAGNVADTSTNLTVGAGNAAAAGTVGAANAISGGASSLTNQLTTLSKLFGSGTSGVSDPGYTFDAGGVPISDVQGSMGGVAGGAAGDYSDERLKTDSRRVGWTDDGLPIFTYRMKGGGPTKMGVMAQDVEKRNPRAVTKDPHGLRMVDYRQIH